MQNKGLELELNYNILNRNAFSWNVFANWSRNINEVIDLAGTDNITLGGFSSTSSTVAKVGYAMSSLYGGVYQRTENGSLALNANGFSTDRVVVRRSRQSQSRLARRIWYEPGLQRRFPECAFETSQGGDFYNGTRGVMYHFGTHADVGTDVTLTQDLKNYSGKVVAAGTTVRGKIQDFGAGPVLLDEAYYTSIGGGFSTLVEQFISDGSWTRLREVSLGYSLNSAKFRQKTRLQSIDFTVTGRNPVLWTKVVGIDPETGLNGTGNSRGQDYFNSPNTRSLLFSVKINY